MLDLTLHRSCTLKSASCSGGRAKEGRFKCGKSHRLLRDSLPSTEGKVGMKKLPHSLSHTSTRTHTHTHTHTHMEGLWLTKGIRKVSCYGLASVTCGFLWQHGQRHWARRRTQHLQRWPRHLFLALLGPEPPEARKQQQNILICPETPDK